MTTPALRSYQAAAVASVRAHWSAGRRRVVCCLPTGAGKTVVATALLAGATRPLALVHTRTLATQTRRRCPGVRVLTIQSALAGAARRDGTVLAALAAADVVFVDECHHLASASWVRVLSLLSPTARIVGCTATPVRADGTALGTGGAGFDAMVATAPYSALLRAGHLAAVTVVATPGMAPAAAYLAHGRAAAGGWRPGILFAPTIAECTAAVATLSAAGVRAASIDATTPGRARAAAFAAYEAGEIDLLASPMALSEGFDSPRAAVCVLDRACAHVGTYMQMAGRVLRPHPSKDPASGGAPALVLDCRGASELHGSPTDDRVYSLEGEGIRPAARAATPGGGGVGGAVGRAGAARRVARPSGVVRRSAPAAAGYAIGSAARELGQAVAGLWRSLWAA
jgi:superfamily II DNA or RNA helicase